ncbi:hypothetical protein V6N11_050130 [Hibiscus sabdariffa]|uniref:Uncharacterized protein n=1 Tax=Hibiscus sabdariffa TaxID=183260 RepID=A0ABR2T9K1_9ROSI
MDLGEKLSRMGQPYETHQMPDYREPIPELRRRQVNRTYGDVRTVSYMGKDVLDALMPVSANLLLQTPDCQALQQSLDHQVPKFHIQFLLPVALYKSLRSRPPCLES